MNILSASFSTGNDLCHTGEGTDDGIFNKLRSRSYSFKCKLRSPARVYPEISQHTKKIWLCKQEMYCCAYTPLHKMKSFGFLI